MKPASLIRLAFLVSSSLVLLGACGGESEKAASPKVIRFWHINNDPASQELFKEIGREFEDNAPDVRVEVVSLDNLEYKPKLELQFAADDPPELFHSWGGGGLAEQAEAGFLKDITAWVEGGRWPVRINPAFVEIYSWNDRIYGFPHDLGAVGFWYNGNLLRNAGYSSFPEDWDAVLGMLDDLKNAGVTPVSLGMADQWPVMYYWVYFAIRIGGADLFAEIKDGERDFLDPALVDAAAMMQEFYGRNYLPESHLGDDFLSQSRLMGDGECAMQLMGQWALAIQAQASERKDELAEVMQFAPFPSVAGGIGDIGDAMGGGNGFVVGSRAPAEAVNLLMYFSEPRNLQRYFDVFPAVPTAAEVSIASPKLSVVRGYVQRSEKYALYPDQLFPREIGVLLNETSTRIMIGELTPEEGCRIMDEAWRNRRDS